MTINRLTARALTLDITPYQALLAQPLDAETTTTLYQDIQPRLYDGLTHFLHPKKPARFLLIKAPGTTDYLDEIADIAREYLPEDEPLHGGHYTLTPDGCTFRPAETEDSLFATTPQVICTDWCETGQLFGNVHNFNGQVSLQPGLLHQANGGILILSVRLLLEQPLIWMRLKTWINQGRFDWLPPDESKPLPLAIPALPLDVQLILVGDRDELAEFEDLSPDMLDCAIYTEYEDELIISDEEDIAHWRDWVRSQAGKLACPTPQEDAWAVLFETATRYTEDQAALPISPTWFRRLFTDIGIIANAETFSATELTQLLEQQAWREGWLAERILDDILDEQIRIDTEGARPGQINALSVIDFPGHPRPVGEPSRISCVVHVGDGEFTDIERKAELGGNIHAKGMMIMQAFLMSALQLDQQIPFSASLTFEQSYSEVDGDSASMAELCALISALADVPVFQNIAITGSVDQFGMAQPVGGLNEKIEGFFTVCEQRGLTGSQGVIIPLPNVRHLSLNAQVRQAVENEQFFIWAVDDVFDALPLLTGLPWDSDIQGQNNLMQLILERIAQASQQDGRHRLPWPLRWLNWFNHN